MNRVLINTNIFVYGIDEDSIYYRQAEQILNQGEKQLVTTAKQDPHNLLTSIVVWLSILLGLTNLLRALSRIFEFTIPEQTTLNLIS